MTGGNNSMPRYTTSDAVHATRDWRHRAAQPTTWWAAGVCIAFLAASVWLIVDWDNDIVSWPVRARGMDIQQP